MNYIAVTEIAIGLILISWGTMLVTYAVVKLRNKKRK